MRPQRKIMMVETTHAFVKLIGKQIKAAVSAGGIKLSLANPRGLRRVAGLENHFQGVSREFNDAFPRKITLTRQFTGTI